MLQPVLETASLVPRLSPLMRGKPGTFYHVRDIKSRFKVDTT